MDLLTILFGTPFALLKKQWGSHFFSTFFCGSSDMGDVAGCTGLGIDGRVLIMSKIVTVVGLVLFPILALAQTAAPQMVNVQSVLVDEGGNVLTDKQEDDIIFSIVDGANTVYYTEVQHVIIINGAISVLVGKGNDPVTGQPTRGIPYDAFSPDGDRLLRVKLTDQSIPQDDLQIVSVPYSMYSQLALG